MPRVLRAGREAKRDRNPRAYIGGRPAFGYRADPKTHELVIDSEAATIVRSIFERARRRDSVRAIAAELDAKRTGDRRWHPTQVARILAHEGYKRKRPGQIVDGKVWNAAQAALASRRKRAA